MSTQSPHPPTPKGSRNNRRQPKKNTTPHTQKAILLNTPPSSPPRNLSPAGVANDLSSHLHSKKKKPPRSGKKLKDMSQASPAPNYGHRHTSSNPNITPQLKDSAYAGPTFHASPAPSALPIPSFFSKSFPESDLAPALETDSDNAETEAELETTPSKLRARPQPTGDAPNSTPLDFLFKAAVQARQSNPTSPEATSRVRSPQTEPKRFHSNPAGGMFTLEMDAPERSRASQIGPSFATSYQDRMNALRSSSSQSQSSDTEEQRRIKTEQLKQMLLNPRPQKPPSSVSPSRESPTSHRVRPNINGAVPHYATPMRTTSDPPTTLSGGYSPGQHQQMPNIASRPSYPYSNGPAHVRNTESPLRREVPTNNYHPGAFPSAFNNQYMGITHSPATAPASQTNFASPQPQYATAAFNMPTNSPSPSQSIETKKMEDDLRRILKLDAAPGIQSSFA